MTLCAFCKQPSIGACSWPVQRFVVDELENVHPGDTICRFKEDPSRRRGTARVATIEQSLGGLLRVTLTILRIDGKRSQKVFEANPFARVRVLRTVPCGAEACENDVRDVGDRLYCRDHWTAWECAA